MGERLWIEIPDIYKDSFDDLAENEGLGLRQYVGLMLLRAVGNLEDEIQRITADIGGAPGSCGRCHCVHDGTRLVDCIETLVKLLEIERERVPCDGVPCDTCGNAKFLGLLHICSFGTMTYNYVYCSNCGGSFRSDQVHSCPGTAKWNISGSFTNAACPRCGAIGVHGCSGTGSA